MARFLGKAFEKLLNRVIETQLVSYVVGVLKPHMRHELMLARPRTILAAFELAKAHVARYNELMSECRTTYKGSLCFRSTHKDMRWQSKGTNFSQVTTFPAPTAQLISGLRIRKYTTVEIQERRDNDLYFHYDKKYSPGHRCKGRFLLPIGNNEDGAMEGEPRASKDGPFDEGVISGDVSMLNTMT
nr:Transposon Ty3-G Gag-Pol polyprotein [Ipomoea batatas]